jgi:L-alanine-DL-glutamate epimerase-like enolase superfamily enzyme
MTAFATSAAAGARVEDLRVVAATIPTDEPESDGTLAWDSTTVVVVELSAGGVTGLGWTYGHQAAAEVITSKLADNVVGADVMDIPAIWLANERAMRNAGRQGIAALAISAVDIALWDLKAKLLGLPLSRLLGAFRDNAPIYGSGGFCSYSDERLRDQMRGYVEQGITRVKIKVGRDRAHDRHRAAVVRDAIGDAVEFYVDANGAFARQDALYWADVYAEEFGVSYFEEPVSSEDTEGLRYLRDRVPPKLSIAAGEYGWALPYFTGLVEQVHVVQADVSRCGGITNMLRVGALCQAHQLPFSAHCVPNVSAHACCAIQTLAHIEYFHDHVRIEQLLFDGTLSPEGGALRPDPGRAGLGLELRRDELERHAISGGDA